MALPKLLVVVTAATVATHALLSVQPSRSLLSWGNHLERPTSDLQAASIDHGREVSHQEGPMRLSISIPRTEGISGVSLSEPDYVLVIAKEREPGGSAGPRHSLDRPAGKPTTGVGSSFLQLLRQPQRSLKGTAGSRWPSYWARGGLGGNSGDAGLRSESVYGTDGKQGAERDDGGPADDAPVPLAFRSFINSPDKPVICPDGTKLAHDNTCRLVWKRTTS